MKRRQSLNELTGNALGIMEKLQVLQSEERISHNDMLLWLAVEREATRIMVEARERAAELERQAS